MKSEKLLLLFRFEDKGLVFGLSGFNFGAEAMSERPEGYSELRGLLLCAQDREGWLLGQSDPSNWLLFRCKPHLLLLLGAAILSMLFYVRFRETVMAAGSPDEYLAKKYKKRAPSLQNVKFEVCVAYSHVATSPPFLPISSRLI